MMNDRPHTRRRVKTVTITSGKGGVGKTTIVANLAVALSRMGKNVMVLDADLGLSNIDILLQLAPKYNLQHVLSGEKVLEEVVVEGPCGIKIVPASSGIQELTRLDEFQKLRMLEAFESYEEPIDILLIDTSPGISDNVTFFCHTAQEIVLVVSPEPTSITDGYALIKLLFLRYMEKDFHVIVNFEKGDEDGLRVFRHLSLATERFLNLSLNSLGYIPYDDYVKRSVMRQRTYVELYPDCPAARRISEIAPKIAAMEPEVKGKLQFFLSDMLGGSSSGWLEEGSEEDEG